MPEQRRYGYALPPNPETVRRGREKAWEEEKRRRAEREAQKSRFLAQRWIEDWEERVWDTLYGE